MHVHCKVNVPLKLSPTITVYGAAYVVDTLPHTMNLILGQPFLLRNKCNVRFGESSVHFEISNCNQTFRVSRPCVEIACKSQVDFHTIFASQLNSLPKESVFSVQVSVIQRDFKVQC